MESLQGVGGAGLFQPLQKDNMLYEPLIGSVESGPLEVRGRSRVSKSLRFSVDTVGFNVVSPVPGRWRHVVTPRVKLPLFCCA